VALLPTRHGLQEECEGHLLRETGVRSLEVGQLENLTVWSATYDSSGSVLGACCQELCSNFSAVRDAGVLERITQHEGHVTAAVTTGMFVCLDAMVRHAMESGLLSDAAGLSVYPTEL
jgi:hypothetical protein